MNTFQVIDHTQVAVKDKAGVKVERVKINTDLHLVTHARDSDETITVDSPVPGSNSLLGLLHDLRREGRMRDAHACAVAFRQTLWQELTGEHSANYRTDDYGALRRLHPQKAEREDLYHPDS